MLSVAVLHSGGAYQRRVKEYLESFPGAAVTAYQLPADVPLMLEEEEAAIFLPTDAAHASVVIAIQLPSALLAEVPFMMGKGVARALLVPREAPSWVRPGLMNQVTRSCARFGIENAFPKPFCALEPMTPLITQFCDEYMLGKPHISLESRDGLIDRATCLTSSACGLTSWVAEQLVGQPCNETLVRTVAELLHLRPCLASMAMDDEEGDTIMHHSIALMEQAARDALEPQEAKLT